MRNKEKSYWKHYKTDTIYRQKLR